jgi:hypothetical protein
LKDHELKTSDGLRLGIVCAPVHPLTVQLAKVSSTSWGPCSQLQKDEWTLVQIRTVPLPLITAACLALTVFGQLDTGAPPHARDSQWMRLSQPNWEAVVPTPPLFPVSASYFGQQMEVEEGNELGTVQGARSTLSEGRVSGTGGALLPLFPEAPMEYNRPVGAIEYRLSRPARSFDSRPSAER